MISFGLEGLVGSSAGAGTSGGVIRTEALAEIVEQQPQHQDQRPLLRAGDARQHRLGVGEGAGPEAHHPHQREDGVRVHAVYVV